MVAAIRIGRGHVSNEPGVLTQDVGCGGTSAPRGNRRWLVRTKDRESFVLGGRTTFSVVDSDSFY